MSLNKLTIAALFTIMPFASTAMAQEKPTLTIYTYDGFASDWGPGPQLKAGYEATCDCVVDFVGAEDSISALRKAQLEGDSTKADIVLGLDTSVAAEAKSSDLFAPHNTDLSALKLPIDYTSDQFVPFDYGYFAFVYRKSDFPEAPTSFEDLDMADDDFKIVIQDPRSSTPGLGLVLWAKAVYGDDTEEMWPDLKKYILTVTKGWSESYSLFLDGEADMVLSYTTSPSYHKIAEGDDNYAAAIFDEGHYVQVELAGILKSSKNQELAQGFMKYLVSQDAQKIIPTTNWMFPVIELEGGLPEDFATPLSKEQTLLLADDVVAANTKAYIDAFFAGIE
ncbi:thiamine ABC transporter substrate binding subunit [Maritalea sp.]|jgi:thiamine transport system substrate-binding protein|uniref:thiamine ABC transporter substrate binding subunit n=1 Tax=Maritalea sp. TaxID=2003361 RepID=UPI0039E6DB89